MKILDFIKEYFNGDRNKAAESAEVSINHLNNWVSKEREVMRLDNGQFILVNQNNKYFKVKT
jgi:hypothetical protein